MIYKSKDRAARIPLKTEINSDAMEGSVVPASYVAPTMADYELLQVVIYIQLKQQSSSTIHMFARVIVVADLSRTTSGCFFTTCWQYQTHHICLFL